MSGWSEMDEESESATSVRVRPRIVLSNIADLATNRYSKNFIRTTKYTYWNFLPLFLFFQFRSNVFNFFFLCGAIINVVPEIRVYHPFTTFAPLVFVLAVAGIREFAEDSRRRRFDRLANRAPVLTCRDGVVAKRQCADIAAGDLVVLENDSEVPCDLVLLATGAADGNAYLQTTNLDGESNLKLRRAVPFTQARGARALQDFHLAATIEQPNAILSSFNGSLTAISSTDVEMFEDPTGDTPRGERKRELYRAVASGALAANGPGQTAGLSSENLLLRGCRLRDTPLAVGLAVYCGHETKSMLNTATTGNKLSHVTRDLDRKVKGLICFHLTLTFICALASVLLGRSKTGLWYLDGAGLPDDATAADYAAHFFIFLASFAILLGLIVPISLFVSMDVARYIIARIMELDGRLHLPGAGPERRMAVRASSLIEELGYVQYVFTDKTGTLTENEMVGDTFWAPDAGVWQARGQTAAAKAAEATAAAQTTGRLELVPTPASHIGERVAAAADVPAAPESGACDDVGPTRLLEALAVCNSVQTGGSAQDGEDVDEHVTFDEIASLATAEDDISAAAGTAAGHGPISRPGTATATGGVRLIECEADLQPRYAAESPDELALVELAAANGWIVVDRPTADTLEVYTRSAAVLEASVGADAVATCRVGPLGTAAAVGTYTISAVFPFDSDRKRMSVLMAVADGYRLVMKGADSAVLPRCTAAPASHLAAANAVLDAASDLGLRTLVVAERHIDGAVGAAFVVRWRAALGLADADEKAAAMATLMAELEDEDLSILGVTAIEDRLQDGVPETLAFLRRAGVRPWMLTGDKLQTAINIGRSARLVGRGQQIVRLTGADNVLSVAHVRPALAAASRLIAAGGGANVAEPLTAAASPTPALFLDGGVIVPQVGPAAAAVVAEDDIESDDTETGAPAAAPPSVRQRLARVMPFVTDPREPCSFELDACAGASAPALVVDGAALTHILEGDPDMFIRVAGAAGAVIVCRASPKQKAECVSLMRDTGKVVAAVGDGANDVSMIQVASVGVGIAGREGLQASRCADFSVSRFRHLQRLLAVHGRYNYHRMCSIVLYSFYKNCASVFGSVAFAFVSMFSSATALDSLSMMFFNLFFSSLPILAICIFDRDLPEFALEACPSAYVSNQQQHGTRASKFARWMLLGVYTGLIAFAASYIGAGHGLLRADGRSSGMGTFNLVFVAVVFGAISVRVGLAAADWPWPFTAALGLTLVVYFSFQWAGSAFGDLQTRGVFHEAMIEPGAMRPFWICSTVGVALASLPSLIFHYLHRQYFPSTAHTLAEFVRCKERFGGVFKHAKNDTIEARWAQLRARILAEKMGSSPLPYQAEETAVTN